MERPDDRVVVVDPDRVEEVLLDGDELVEYFVLVDPLVGCDTSVPRLAQESQTSSSAPSTLIVFGAPVSAPHISHWTIPKVHTTVA